MAYVPATPLADRRGDIIALTDEKAGALVLSTPLASWGRTSTDAVRMFARRDAFRTVAEAIAQAGAALPWDLYRRDDQDGRQKIGADSNDPGAGLAYGLDNPVPGSTQYRWVEGSWLDWVLHDRWASLIELQDDGTVQLIRLPAKWVSFAVDGLRRITDVVVSNARGGRVTIPADQCLFDVGYDPNPVGSSTTGFAVSTTLEGSAMELEKGAAWRSALLDNGPKVPMYVARPANAPDWQKSGARQRFVDSFKAYSTERAGETPLLEDGMELKAAPQLDINGVDYRATRAAAQIEFSIAMHFPPELVGYRQGTNSNLETLREQLYVDVLGGKIVAFRQALNGGFRRAKVMLPGYYVEENIGARLASTPEKQATTLQTQVGAPVRTVNEARRMLNLPLVPGGDDLIVPLNVTKGGLASPTDTGPKALGELTATVLRTKAATGATPAGFKAAADIQRDRFAAELRTALKAQVARIRAALGSASSPGPLETAFDLNTENDALTAAVLPHAYAIATTGATGVLAKWNAAALEADADAATRFDFEKMLPWLTKAAAATANRVNTVTLGALAGAVFDDDWTKAVDSVLERLVDAQPGVVAATTSTTSKSFGGQDAARFSSLTVKTWRSSHKSNSRHASLDGQTVPIGDAFSNGLRYPGDPAGPADEVANCGCDIEFGPAE